MCLHLSMLEIEPLFVLTRVCKHSLPIAAPRCIHPVAEHKRISRVGSANLVTHSRPCPRHGNQQKNLTSGICQLSHTLEALGWPEEKKARTSILKLKPGWLEEKKTRRLIPHARTLPHPHCTISAPNGIKGSVDSTIPRGRLPPPDCTKTPTICIPEISSHQGRGPSR